MASPLSAVMGSNGEDESPQSLLLAQEPAYADHVDTINLFVNLAQAGHLQSAKTLGRNNETKDDLSLVVSCAGVRHFLDRESVIAQSPWFAKEIRTESRTIATMQGFAMTFLKVVDVQHECFTYIVSFLRTGLYVPSPPPPEDPWRNLPLHTKIYFLALRFQLAKLKAFTIAAFEHDITQKWPQNLEHYIQSLRILFADQLFDTEKDIQESPDPTTLKYCAVHHLAKYFPLFLEDESFRTECRFDRFRVLLLHALAYDECLTDSISGKVMRAYFENQTCSHGATGMQCRAGFTRDIFDFVAESLSTERPMPMLIKPLNPLFEDSSSSAAMSKEKREKMAEATMAKEKTQLDPTAMTFESRRSEGTGETANFEEPPEEPFAAPKEHEVATRMSKEKLNIIPEAMDCDDDLSKEKSQLEDLKERHNDEIREHANSAETPKEPSVAAKELDSCSVSNLPTEKLEVTDSMVEVMNCHDSPSKEKSELDPTAMAFTSQSDEAGEYTKVEESS